MKLTSLLLSGIASAAMLSAAQAQTPSAYYLGRIGLFTDPIHTNTGLLGNFYTQLSFYNDELTESGFATGRSLRFNYNETVGEDVWVANTLFGPTYQIGLTVPSTNFSTVEDITESGLVIGNSRVFLTNPGFPPAYGFGTWVADAINGVTIRTGFYSSPEFTSTDGLQQSTNRGISESGLVYGDSQRFNGNTPNGSATWMVNTDNGVTSRIGYFGPAYTATGNLQFSYIVGASDLEYVAGNSARYSGSASHGYSAWVAARVNGATYPVGLYLPPTYLRADGYGNTTATGITKSGYVFGQSARFSGNTDLGRTAWAHNLSNNTVKALGLTGAGYTLGSTGYQVSDSTAASESGFIGGHSQRFAGAVPIGQAAWVAAFSDAISVRGGLTTPEFTKSTGFQSSTLRGITPQGNAYGRSERYVSDVLKGHGTWVLNKSTGVTTQVGFFDAAHTGFDGSQINEFFPFPPSTAGWITGSSQGTRWAASTNTGVTIRLGLTGPDYVNSNGHGDVSLTGFTTSSHAYGTSKRYVAGVALGQAAWVADFNNTGASVRIGLFGTPEFVLANGSENTVIEGATKSGYVWGYSSRSEASGGGRVGWVYNLNTGTQQTVQAQVSIDGKTSTGILGVTENGLIYGNFASYHPVTGVSTGSKSFLWSPAKGYVVLDDQIGGALNADNWTSIGQFKMNSAGLILGGGERGTNTQANPGGYGTFRAYFAP